MPYVVPSTGNPQCIAYLAAECSAFFLPNLALSRPTIVGINDGSKYKLGWARRQLKQTRQRHEDRDGRRSGTLVRGRSGYSGRAAFSLLTVLASH